MSAREEYIAGLRAFADLLERDADLPLPDQREVHWYRFSDRLTADEQKAQAADLVRRLPGKQDKRVTIDLFRFHGQIRGLKTQVIVQQSAVCERVVTGTRQVEKQIPTAFDTVTETVEDVEWVCKPLLAEVTP